MITALVVASLWLDAGAVATDPEPASSPPTSDVSGAEGADRAPPSADSSALLVERAAQQYDHGLLDDALATLEQAQRLSPDPSIVYNIAQIQRKRGDCAAALRGYNRYLETAAPTDAKRAMATRWATEMKTCVAQDAPSLPPVPPPPPPPPPSPGGLDGLPPGGPPPPRGDVSGHVSGRRARIAGWSMVAAGGLCEIAAIVFQSMASEQKHKIDSHPFNDSGQSGWLSSWNRYTNWALGTAIAGGALVAGGATVLIINLQSDPATPRATMVGLAGTF